MSPHPLFDYLYYFQPHLLYLYVRSQPRQTSRSSHFPIAAAVHPIELISHVPITESSPTAYSSTQLQSPRLTLLAPTDLPPTKTWFFIHHQIYFNATNIPHHCHHTYTNTTRYTLTFILQKWQHTTAPPTSYYSTSAATYYTTISPTHYKSTSNTDALCSSSATSATYHHHLTSQTNTLKHYIL